MTDTKPLTVTITGADDGVDPNHLIALSREFPFVEWGILYSTKRSGTPRYPTNAWMRSLHEARGAAFGILGIHSPTFPKFSLHLCGQAARETAKGRADHIDHCAISTQRVQLNGYEPTDPDEHPQLEGLAELIYQMPYLEFILQARDAKALVGCASDARALKNASVLYDPSGGRGIHEGVWPSKPARDVRTGYAGGIWLGTIQEAIRHVVLHNADWIDMESGVRTSFGMDAPTSDDFDLNRVRAVLEAAAQLIGGNVR